MIKNSLNLKATISVSTNKRSLPSQLDHTKQEPTPPPPTVGSGILEDGANFDPLKSPPSRDFLPDYIVTVIVPLIIAIVLCLLLAYIMFFRREGVYAFIF